MGKRRKTRKLIVRPKRRLPTIFQCPYCGSTAVNVVMDKKAGKVRVVCGVCGLEAYFDKVNGFLPVDYYNKFVDLFYAGQIKPAKQVEGKQVESVGKPIETDEGVEYDTPPEVTDEDLINEE